MFRILSENLFGLGFSLIEKAFKIWNNNSKELRWREFKF